MDIKILLVEILENGPTSERMDRNLLLWKFDRPSLHRGNGPNGVNADANSEGAGDMLSKNIRGYLRR